MNLAVYCIKYEVAVRTPVWILTDTLALPQSRNKSTFLRSGRKFLLDTELRTVAIVLSLQTQTRKRHVSVINCGSREFSLACLTAVDEGKNILLISV
jgi:hypothetical protein